VWTDRIDCAPPSGQHVRVDGVTDERIVEEVVGRLGSTFPRLPKDFLATKVSETLRSFGDARIRDFLPVLVERKVLSALKPLAD